MGEEHNVVSGQGPKVNTLSFSYKKVLYKQLGWDFQKPKQFWASISRNFKLLRLKKGLYSVNWCNHRSFHPLSELTFSNIIDEIFKSRFFFAKFDIFLSIRRRNHTKMSTQCRAIDVWKASTCSALYIMFPSKIRDNSWFFWSFNWKKNNLTT